MSLRCGWSFKQYTELIKHLPDKQRQNFIWDRIIYAQPDQGHRNTARTFDPYKPLVTYDNHEEVIKIAQARRPAFRLACFWLRVPNTDQWSNCRANLGAFTLGEAARFDRLRIQ